MTILLWGAIIISGIFLALPTLHLIRNKFARVYPPTSQFSVAVIVPCKGNNDPDFENNLLNIVQQSYDGGVEYIFCVESEHDSALPVLHHLDATYPQVQVCIAGLATRCSQKTFNILKGMECASDPDIFVIADADIQPHPTWLQELVGPFSDPNIGAVTGFYRRVPMTPHFRLGDYLATFFSAIIMTGVSDNRLKSLWGGSLAVRKKILDQHNLYERFATEIVDDVAIMHALHKHNIERRYVQSCTLKSYCDMSVKESVEWFLRQIQFLQIYFKPVYWFYSAIIFVYVIYLFLTPVIFLYGLVANHTLALGTSIGFWVLTMLTSYLLYVGISSPTKNNADDDTPYSLGRWLLMTPVGFLYSWLSMVGTTLRVKNGVLTMNWRSIEYEVDSKTGKVLKVSRYSSINIEETPTSQG